MFAPVGKFRNRERKRLRVAEALEELPGLDRALRDGELGWLAVRELTRVATLKTESEWIRAARGRTVRDIEKLVSGRNPGDRPADPARTEAKRHTCALTCRRKCWRLFETR